LTVENWSNVKAYGERYEYKELLVKIVDTLSELFNDAINAKNFVELDVDELKYLLSLENKIVESEEKVYEAVIGWIKHDLINREKFVGELLSFVKFSEMSLDFFNLVVAKETIIRCSFVTMQSFINAIVNCKRFESASKIPAKRRNQKQLTNQSSLITCHFKTFLLLTTNVFG